MDKINFSIRLDPKVAYMLEVLARSNNTTRPKMVEAAIKKLLEQDEDAADMFGKTWDIDEEERIKNLASYKRSMLTYDEEKVLNGR